MHTRFLAGGSACSHATTKLLAALSLLAMLPLGACGTSSGSADAAHGRVGPRLADAMLRAGDAPAALRVADALLDANPRDIDARAQRGRALLALGRAAEAADDLAGVARQRPGDPATLSALAAARAAEGNPALAETAWRAVLARRPEDRAAHIGLAIALDLQDHHAGAQTQYREVLRDHPDDVTASIDLGLSLALSGQPREALTYLDREGIAPAGPGGARARHDLAVALVLAGDEARARSVLSLDMSETDISAAIESVRALGPS